MSTTNDNFVFDISREQWKLKYAQPNESYEEFCRRVVDSTIDNHYREDFYNLFYNRKCFYAGRILYGVGSTRKNVTFSNCYVIPVLHDSMVDIMDTAKNAALVMKSGGGLGYASFSVLRPSGAKIYSSGEESTGTVSFMGIFDALTKTIKAGGNRRGANMGPLDVWHPDIINFIKAKRDGQTLTQFNISVAINDKFMKAVKDDEDWDLIFPDTSHPKYNDIWGAKQLEEFYKWYIEYPYISKDEVIEKYKKACKNSLQGNIYKWMELGYPVKVYQTIKARQLYDMIMESNYHYAEPGVLFVDTINTENNLYYLEDIRSTNPCGEQPLFAYGSCNLGSINLSTFVKNPFEENAEFNWDEFDKATRLMVRGLDRVLDINYYPLDAQKIEVELKRPIGLGFTGLADCLAMMRLRYSSEEGRSFSENIFRELRNIAYDESINLAKEKGSFPLFNYEKFINSPFIQRLPLELKEKIKKYGIRNCRVLSIAPTGTISLSMGNNCSGGIEPIFNLKYVRRITQPDGSKKEEIVRDYAYEIFTQKYGEDAPVPRYFETAYTLKVEDHIKMQAICQKYIDTSISKTINIPKDYDFEDFKKVYEIAYDLGLKGCTTYRPNDVTGSVFVISEEKIKDYFFVYEDETHQEAYTRFRKWFGLENISTTQPENTKPVNNVANKSIDNSNNIETTIKQIENGVSNVIDMIKELDHIELALLPTNIRQKVIDLATSLGINILYEKDLLEEEDARRYRIRWKGIKIYVNVVHDENGNPLELFAQLPQEAGINGDDVFKQELFLERLSYWHSICRLTSLALRYGLPLEEIIKQLKKSSYNITHLSGILSRLLSKYPLKEFIDDESDIQIDETHSDDQYADSTNSNDDVDQFSSVKKCPVCKSVNLIYESGCDKCLDCGYSKCG